MDASNHSLPLQFSKQPERHEKLFFEKLELVEKEDQGDKELIVFHGQCMVLGNSGVGKTSLVNSLTGKPFDPRQARTYGVDECLVDEKWKCLNMKELVFGNLWRFFKSGFLQVLLIGTGSATSNVILENVWLWKPGFQFTSLMWALMGISLLFQSMIHNSYLPVGLFLFHFMTLVPEIAPFCAFHFTRNKLRFIVATLSLILRRRGLLIGSYLVFAISYWNQTYPAAIVSNLVSLATVAAIVLFITLFVLIGPISMPFVNNNQQSYTCLFIQNRLTMKIISFCRLLLSVLIGFIYGFVAALLVGSSFRDHESIKQSLTLLRILNNPFNYFNYNQIPMPFTYAFDIGRFCVYPFVWQFPVACLEEKTTVWIWSSTFDRSWGAYALLIVLVFYHCKLAWYSCTFYFAVVFPLFICYTFYVELLCLHSTISGNFGCPNKLITLVIAKNTEMNKKMLNGALNAKLSSLKLKILDFAGDKEYYAYHHMFLRSGAIYIIVFNMVEFVENDFSDLSAKLLRLKFWFESVCSHVPRKAPIFLVGTHRGTIDQNRIKVLDSHLRRNLWNTYCDELVVNDVEDLLFFPVENSEGQNDIGVQNLQKEIVSSAEQCKATIGRDIPLTWIRIQDAIIRLQEKKEVTFCVTLAEFPRAFDDFVCNSCSKETLKYFHEKGLVIYLDRNQNVDLSNWVLLKPELLVDIIIQLVTPPPEDTQQRGLRHDWNLLQKKGMLTKSLLKSIINKVQENEEAMTAFLEEYDLICPLLNEKVQMYGVHDEDEKQPNHFVPSLLPMSADGDIPVWHDDDDADKKFYVFFDRFLPQPLFHRLLSRAHKNSKVEFPNGQTVLYRDSGKFWMSGWQPYMLKLMKGEKMIEVTFSYSTSCGMRPSDVLCQVFSMVDGICKRYFPYIKFHCGPACPSQTCPGHQDDVLSSYPAAVDQGTKRHVYDVMPGRQGDRIAFLYCENHSFEQALDEWIP